MPPSIPPSWKPLLTVAAWNSSPGGAIVIHQHIPTGPTDAPWKYHSRDCRWASADTFLTGPAKGTNHADWFWAPDFPSASTLAQPCKVCQPGT